jgi:putative DNA-invertase from lambdoid prophage Rac
VIVVQLGKLDLTSRRQAHDEHTGRLCRDEYDLLVKRTWSDLAHANAEGKTLGRPTSTIEEQRVAMTKQHQPANRPAR